MLTYSTPRQRATRTIAIGMVMLMLLVAALASAPAAAAPLAQALTGSIDFDPSPVNASNNGTKSAFPSVVVDRNNNFHVLYTYGLDSDGSLYYTNNIGGSFRPSQKIEGIPKADALPYSALAYDSVRNTLHMVYARVGDNYKIYYRQGAISGSTVTWSDRQQISTANKAFGPRIAIDADGNAHIVWIDNSTGNYNVFYRERLLNGGLSAITGPRPDGKFQNAPDITITNGQVHIVFTYNSNAEIDYARMAIGSNAWTNITNISKSPGNKAFQPSIMTDGTQIFVSWLEKVDGNNSNVWFTRSFDNGQTWPQQEIRHFSDTPEFAGQPHSAYSPLSKRVYTAWIDATNSDDPPNTEIWFREFDPATGATGEADRVSHFRGASLWPWIAAAPANAVGTPRADIVWHDNTSGTYQIYSWGGNIIGGQGCTIASLQLEGGRTQTTNNPIQASITPSNCQPNTMQISVDTPLTASTTSPPQQGYNQNPSIDIPSGGCAHTVYVRLFTNGQPGPVKSASIVVDKSVQADVRALNPNLSGLSTVYTQVSPADALASGAKDGDPDFTRNRSFFLGITNAGDCTGLRSFQVLNGISGTIPAGGYANAVALPGDNSAGSKQITVIVSDALGNPGTYNRTLYYDPDKPTLNGGSVSGSSGNSVIRTLTFSGVSVNDALYGQVRNLPAGRQFWGVWIANANLSATPNITPDNPGLNWAPVKVQSPNAAFTVQWSLFSGLGYAPDGTHSGNYRVFVRFLDGAGNPTDGVLTDNVTLAQGYTIPTVALPIIKH